MGNCDSRDNAAKNPPGFSGFSAPEKTRVQNLYIKLFSAADTLQVSLKEIFPPPVISRISHEMAHFSADLPVRKAQQHIGEANFYSMVAYLVNGTADQKAHVVRHLASTHPMKELNAKELYAFVRVILTSYCAVLGLKSELDEKLWTSTPTPEESEIDQLVMLSLTDLLYPRRKERLESSPGIPDCVYTNDDLVRWMGNTALFPSCFSYVFQHAFPVLELPEKSLLPMFLGKSTRAEHTNLLTVSAVIAINQSIPLKLREKWTLLFDSRKHGESFTTLLRNVKQQSNTVLLVRDLEGNVFGGFTTAVWSNHAAFQGSIDNFLFSLSPTMDIYRPSGLNTNYFYLNTGQETLPNGMGMGGQFDYFGLWLDCEYGKGHSMAKPLSTTYHSPTLSHSPQFTYTDLEVWRVSNIQEDLELEEERAEKAAAAATSILDSDPGAKAMLELIGKGNLSDGMRESDPTASNPEETTPPLSGHAGQL